MLNRPNIVYILADDLGYGDLSCYGSDKVNTPHVDQLAEEGMRFTHAHAPSAVCTPTRYSVMTGRYCWRSRLKAGVLSGYSPPLIEADRLTVPILLRENNYRTTCIGKWHLGLGWEKKDGEIDYTKRITGGPIDLGFDSYFGIAASLDMPPYCFIKDDRPVEIPRTEKEPKDFSQQDRPGLMSPNWKDEEVNTVLTKKARSFMMNHVENEEEDPFFLYLPLTGPHTPWTPAKEFKGKSKIGPRGDMILELDWTVGEITRTLKELDLWENTLFIVTSDNGPHPHTDEIRIHEHLPAGNLRGQKADIWEGGHRIPFIACWPNQIEAGTSSEALICLTDLLATCAEIVDEKLPETTAEDTVSMLALLTGEREVIRDSVVHHSITGMYAIRQGKWKLIVGQGSGGFGRVEKDTQIIGIPTQGHYQKDHAPGQLYNMEEDEEEVDNLYLENPELVNTLTSELIQIINNGYNSL